MAAASRSNARSKAQNNLNELHKIGRENGDISDEQCQLILKNQKVLSVPDENVTSFVLSWVKQKGIEHVCAPFEAEWQLVYMERMGIIDYVVR